MKLKFAHKEGPALRFKAEVNPVKIVVVSYIEVIVDPVVFASAMYTISVQFESEVENSGQA